MKCYYYFASLYIELIYSIEKEIFYRKEEVFYRKGEVSYRKEWYLMKRSGIL
jgi:hypothetical protein